MEGSAMHDATKILVLLLDALLSFGAGVGTAVIGIGNVIGIGMGLLVATLFGCFIGLVTAVVFAILE
jgi:hypothetical protein